MVEPITAPKSSRQAHVPVNVNNLSSFPSPAFIALETVKDGAEAKFLSQAQPNGLEIEFKQLAAEHILKSLVIPEMELRVKAGLIKPQELRKIQIVFHSDPAKNYMLVNDQVRFRGIMKLKPGIHLSKGDDVMLGQIKEIYKIEPWELEPNVAYVNLLKLGSRWEIDVQLLYNKEYIEFSFKRADEFFDSAKNALDNKQYGVFIDSLFNCMELMASAYAERVFMPKEEYRNHHKYRLGRFKDATVGKPDLRRYVDAYQKLYNMRKPARYVNENATSDFALNGNKAQQIFELVSAFKQYLKRDIDKATQIYHGLVR